MKMKCGYCGVENSEATNFCTNCDKLLATPAPQRPLQKSDYATLALNKQNARFYAKRGFDLKAGIDILPTKPIQTASAATPTFPLPKPRTKPVEAMAAKSLPTKAVPDPHEGQAPPLSSATAKLERHQSRRISVSRSSRIALIGSVFVVCFATVLGMTWRPPMPSITTQPKPVAANPLPLLAANSAVTTPQQEATDKGTRATRENDAWAIGKIPPDNIDEAAPDVVSTPAPSRTAQSRQEATHSSTVAPNNSVATLTKRTNTLAAQKSSSAKKFAKKRIVNRVKKQSPDVGKRDRGEEIDRLKTQAFSETKKDRIDRVTTPASPPGVTRQFSPLSVKQKTFREKGATYVATRDAYRKCQRYANFFRRERCKWDLCSGKWGQHGCPAYDHVDSSIF